ncbi:hypothetical protein H0H87_006933 [Tephrocybe sp. NHM501043]|nr:hypothetical protein H0H87_006933 [Tephrocybe sp. NHM501043]
MKLPSSTSFVVTAALIASSSTASMAAPTSAPSDGDVIPSGNKFRVDHHKNVVHAAAAEKDENAEEKKGERLLDGLLKGLGLDGLSCKLLKIACPPEKEKATEHEAASASKKVTRDLPFEPVSRDDPAADTSITTLPSTARPSVPDDQLLTPRTPHSRSGRAEEAYTEFELQQLSEINDDWHEHGHHQSVPLLASSASDSFPASQTTGYRSRGDDHDAGRDGWDKEREGKRKLQMSKCLNYLPLVLGSLLAAFLLFLIYVSYNRPEKLHKYLGITPTNSTRPTHHNSSTAVDPHLLISYENYTSFPLRPSEYLAECLKLNKGYMSHGDYWQPHKMGVMDTPHHYEESGADICDSTVTYMLDGEVGLLADLALLAQVAALAREVAMFLSMLLYMSLTYAYQRNRTLFIDDTYWNRGKPRGLPAIGKTLGVLDSSHKILVAELKKVISSRTAKFHLGHSFSEAYEDPYAHGLNRLKPIFKSSEESFLNTIRLNKENTRLVESARTELLTSTSPDRTPFNSYISLHLRRGDRKPAFYRGDHVPTENFVQAATTLWNRLSPDRSPEDLILYVATDSATALREVVDLTSMRYTTFSLFESANPELRALASPEEYKQNEFDLLDIKARIQATRGMIVDFALLSGMWTGTDDPAPKATVCTFRYSYPTIQATTCFLTRYLKF